LFRNSEDPVHFWPASAGTHGSGEGTTAPLVRHRLTTGLCNRQPTTQHSQTRAAPEPRLSRVFVCQWQATIKVRFGCSVLLPAVPSSQRKFFELPGDAVPVGPLRRAKCILPYSSKVGCLQSRTSDLRGFISRTHRATASCPVVPAPSSASSRPGVAWRRGKHHGTLGPSTSL
jgi:hypothetical protein